MTNIGFTGKEISKKLDTRIIRKGGCVTVTMPVATIKIEEGKNLEFGGYTSLVHYNKDREEQHNTDRWNKKLRKLRKNVIRKGLRQRGLSHIITTSDEAKEFKT